MFAMEATYLHENIKMSEATHTHEFRKKGSGQMIDYCDTNSLPPSVFTFLVGKLPHF